MPRRQLVFKALSSHFRRAFFLFNLSSAKRVVGLYRAASPECSRSREVHFTDPVPSPAQSQYFGSTIGNPRTLFLRPSLYLLRYTPLGRISSRGAPGRACKPHVQARFADRLAIQTCPRVILVRPAQTRPRRPDRPRTCRANVIGRPRRRRPAQDPRASRMEGRVTWRRSVYQTLRCFTDLNSPS